MLYYTIQFSLLCFMPGPYSGQNPTFYKQGSVAVFNIVYSMVSRILCELAAYRIHGMTHYTN